MKKKPEPTIDDYRRFIDDLSMFLTERVIAADRHGNEPVAAALRGVQHHVSNTRSKRGL